MSGTDEARAGTAAEPERTLLLYAAPMEGVTLHPFRNAHHRMFGGVDRYFTPFVTANQTLHFQTRELRDIDPENNLPGDETMHVVPQVLTKEPGQLVFAMAEMARRGYREVNLNLGCPYPTVVTKGKGAGFLADPDRLDRFLEETFTLLEKQKAERFGDLTVPVLTVKTRIGFDDASPAPRLTEIYNRYPLGEVIIHPRLRSAFYEGEPDYETFGHMADDSIRPVCYNGDIRSAADVRALEKRFPKVRRFMAGRALAGDPALSLALRGQSGGAGGSPCTRPDLLQAWTETLASSYLAIGGEAYALARLKELWQYIARMRGTTERSARKLKKTKSTAQLLEAQRQILGL